MNDDMDFLFGSEDDESSRKPDRKISDINDTADIDLNSFSTAGSHKDKTSSGRKKSRKNGKKGKKKERKSVKRAILTAFLICVISVCIILGSCAVYLFCFFDYKLPDDLDELKLNFTTTIYVPNKITGEWVEYQRLYGDENRIWVSLDKMPQNLLDAYVCIEDERFYKHAGVDWKRTMYAFANSVFHFSSTQGGSTIDQQLVKNLTGDKQQSASRKIREIMRALDIDRRYSKDTILECYLNTISLGDVIGGVEVASNYYFSKSVSDLSLTECAALASMTKGPEIYRPDKYPEKNKERRKIVLDKMLEAGKITKEEYDFAINDELVVTASDESIKRVSVNSYFVDALIDDVVEGLKEKYGYEESYAETNFYNGGYKIYASIDQDIQKTMEEVYADTDTYFTQKSKTNSAVTPESAMTVMDYEGHILGIVGGKGTKTTNRSLNRATQSPRQPGSTMKPIGSYALAIDKNLITYSSKVEDKPIKNYFGAGKSGPNNWYKGNKGSVTVKYALEQSINTIPCHLIEELTPETSYNFLTQTLGLKYLDDTDKNLASLGIGGCHRGLTTTESAAAFAIFGNGGNYYKPTTYYKVTDQYGDEIILEDTKEPTKAIGEDSAYIMNQLLQNVINHGTGAGARSYSSLPTFAKTGTADASNDLWFVGGSPYYIGSVWYGFDKLEGIKNQAAAQKIWVAVMKEINSGLEDKDFEKPDSVVVKKFCATSGLVANAGCPVGGTGYYKESYAPVCTTHSGRRVSDSTDDTSSASSSSGDSPQDTPSTDASSSTAVSSSQSSASSGSSTSDSTHTEGN